MKFCIVLMMLVAGGIAAESLTSRFNSAELDEILKNKRTLTAYIKCLMEEGPCTREGRDLKALVPNALANGCSECTDNQKAATEKVINHLKKNHAENWARLVKKYDPEGKYEAQYAAMQAAKKH